MRSAAKTLLDTNEVHSVLDVQVAVGDYANLKQQILPRDNIMLVSCLRDGAVHAAFEARTRETERRRTQGGLVLITTDKFVPRASA